MQEELGIKLEKAPKYRPLDVEECRRCVGRVVHQRGREIITIIIAHNDCDNTIQVAYRDAENGWISAEELYSEYEFQDSAGDRSPCGVLVEKKYRPLTREEVIELVENQSYVEKVGARGKFPLSSVRLYSNGFRVVAEEGGFPISAADLLRDYTIDGHPLGVEIG